MAGNNPTSPCLPAGRAPVIPLEMGPTNAGSDTRANESGTSLVRDITPRMILA